MLTFNSIIRPSYIIVCAYRLEYNPLVLSKDSPDKLGEEDDDKYTLKVHPGNPNDPNITEVNDKDLESESLIQQSWWEENRPKLLVCITMYNEPPKQLIESLIGVYRAYYELARMDDKI